MVSSLIMRIGITTKVFLVILLTSVIVVMLMLTGIRYSLHRGFLDYLSTQEKERMTSVVPRLVLAYRQHGSWDFIRKQPRIWFPLIRPADMLLPEEGAVPPTLPESELTGIVMRFSLLDAQKKLIIGNPAIEDNQVLEKATLQAIQVDGKNVGWLTLMPFEQVVSRAARNFQQQQIRSGWFIASILILLASVVAWVLARLLISPLKKIALSTHLLAAGDYSARVTVSARDEIGALAEDFNRLSVQLEKNEHLRRHFVADIAHELRTPVAVLKGELEAIEDNIRPLSIQSIRSLQTEVIHPAIKDCFKRHI